MTASVAVGKYSERMPATFTPPDEDFYVLKLDDWDEPVRSSFQDKETGEYPLRINLKFKVVSDLQGDIEFEGKDASKFVDLDLNPNVKGSIWHVMLALDPTTEPEAGQQLEPYRGKSLIGEIVHNVKPKKNSPGETVTYANVGAVKPVKKKKVESTAKKNPLLDNDDE